MIDVVASRAPRRTWVASRARTAWLGAALAAAVVAFVAGGAVASHRAAASRAARGSMPRSVEERAVALAGASSERFRIRRDGRLLIASGGALTTSFDRAGPKVSAGGASLGLRLTTVTRGRSPPSVRAVSPVPAGDRVTYRRGAMSEWYVNGPLGLEQGFTLRRRPAGAGALRLTLALSGGLVARQEGQAVTFSRTRTSSPALTYGDLHALDARGRRLPAHLALGGRRVVLVVDDHDARYPLTIDPFVQQGAKLAVASGAAFGFSVALSSDGSTALVGVPNDNSLAGAAYVFVRSGSTWAQQGGKLVPADLGSTDNNNVGESVALSADGNTALLGAPSDSPDGLAEGAAYVFTRSGTTWSEQAKLVGSDLTNGFAELGMSVSLSADGNTALVGGPADNSSAGAAWIFTRSGTTWTQEGSKLTASDETGAARLGFGVALSGDGTTALVSGPHDAGNVGAAWVFTSASGTWPQQGPKLAAGDEVGSGMFGASVALSGDGNTALIGGAAVESAPDQAGAAWAFTRSGSSWSQQGSKLIPSDETGLLGDFGEAVALSGDGNTALIGGPNDASGVGAAWEFARSGSSWSQQGSKFTGTGATGNAAFGLGTALSSDGATALVGGAGDNGGQGAVWPFVMSGVSVTPATGGSAISADTAGGAFTPLTGPVLTEAAPGLIGTGTLVLGAPAGFVFDTAGSPACSGTSGLTASVTAATSAAITCTVTAQSSGSAGALTFSGVALRPAAGTPLASGALSESGTASLPGAAAGYGVLAEVAGAAQKLAFTTEPEGAAAGAPLSAAPVVAIEDQFDNQTASTATVSVAIEPGTGTAGAVLGGTTARSGPAAAFDGLSIDLAGSGYELTAASPGLAAAVSSSFDVTGPAGGGGSGGGGSSSGGTGSGNGGQSILIARLRTEITPGHHLLLDAGGSNVPVGDAPTSYLFRLGTDGQTTVTCPGPDPTVSVLVANAVDTTATVTLTTASGATATSTSAISMPAPSGLPTHSIAGTAFATTGKTSVLAGAQLGQVQALASECMPASGNPPAPGSAAPIGSLVGGDTGPTTSSAAASSCFTAVNIGIVQAIGCFTQVDADHPLPDAEAFQLCKYQRTCATIGAITTGGLFNLAGGAARRRSALDVADLGFDAYYYSTGPVRINGVELDPVDNGVIVLARAGSVHTAFLQKDAAYVISSDAVAKVAGIPVSLHVPDYGALYTQVKSTSTCAQNVLGGNVGCLGSITPPSLPDFTNFGSIDGPVELAVSPENLGIQLGEFTIPANALPLPFLPDLPLTGTVKVSLEALQSAKIDVHLELPQVLTDGSGHGLTGDTSFTVDNQHGLVLDFLHITVPSLAQLGLARLKNLNFTYTRATDLIDGGATLDLSDQIQGVIDAELAFEHGDFQKAHVDYTAAQGGGYPLGGGIFLDYVGADLTLDPTVVSGAANVSVGPALTSSGCGLFGAHGSATLSFGDPVALDLHGETQILCADFGYSEDFHADTDGHVGYGVGIDYPIPGLGSLKGSLYGQAYADVNTGTYHFQLDGNVDANISVKECIGACVTVSTDVGAVATWSDKGAGVCAHLSIHFPDPVGDQGFDVGAGIDNLQQVVTQSLASGGTLTEAALLENFHLLTSNCSLSGWRTLSPPPGLLRLEQGGRTASAPPDAFTVAPGTKLAVVGLKGRGGAPAVVLTRPDGSEVTPTSAAGLGVDRAGILVDRQATSGETLLEIASPMPGRWLVRAAHGSAPIVAAESAEPLPAPSIRVTVSGRGLRRVLHYRVGRQPGLSVLFLERVDRGAHDLGRVTGGTGSLRFTPAIGSAGRRTIVAELYRNGVPAQRLVVARYEPGRIRPGRPGHVRVRHTAAGWRVSFTRGANATSYLLTIRFADGVQALLATRGARHALTIASRIDATEPVAVQIVGLRGSTRGPATVVRASRRPTAP